MRRGKYNAKPQIVDGIRFASKKESLYYMQLKELLKAGRIKNLELQPKFPMPPKPHLTQDQLDYLPKMEQFKEGFICTYIADFRYIWLKGPEAGKTLVVDVKGMKTPVYKLKRRLLSYFYPNVEVIEA